MKRTIAVIVSAVAFLLALPSTALSQNESERRNKDEITRPMFQGEAPESAFLEWFNARIDAEGIRIDQPSLINFTVDKEGRLIRIGDEGNVSDTLLARQITRILEGSPLWTPAHHKRKRYAAAYYLINNDDDELCLKHRGDVDVVEPTFNGGGFDYFLKWLLSNVEYSPELALRDIKGTVKVELLVDRHGQTHIREVISSPHIDLTIQVTRAIIASRWTPGLVEGFLVNTYFIVPVDFQMEIR